MTTVDPAAIHQLAPPDWPPSGACLGLGSRILTSHAVEGDTIPGLPLFQGRRMLPCNPLGRSSQGLYSLRL